MENYLLELIKENNRIIIPNFGAFIVSREKGQNILFNNFLSFNDGLLISHICAVESIDSATAAKKVEDYVSSIKSALDKDGAYAIKGIGVFTKDDNGVLRFEQEVTEQPKEESKSSSATRITDNSAIIDEDLLDLDTEDDKPKTKANKEIPDEHKKYVAPTPPPTVKKSEPPKETIKNTPPSVQAKAKPKPVKEDLKVKVVENREDKFPMWIVALILLILLLLVGAYLWFFTSLFEKSEQPVEPAPVEIVEKPEIIEEEPEVVEPVEEFSQPGISSRQHHIILGSYREEAPAIQMMNRLLQRGITTASILPYEGRFLVSAEWHPRVNKALQRQEELLKELQMENWVLSMTKK